MANGIEYLDLLQPFLETAFSVLAPLVLGLAAAWIKKQISRVQREIDSSTLDFLKSMADQFVKAAEQSGLNGKIEDLGEEKKAYVMALLQAESDRLGLKLDIAVLEAILEAAVVDAFGVSEEVSG
jgi:hypothetical protein